MRTVLPLLDGWRFALGGREAPPEDAAFSPVTLPHDWAIASRVREDAPFGAPQGYFDRGGVGWYRRTLDFAPAPGETALLRFGGVYENCDVFVNGARAGGHRYGYTPFDLDVGALLRAGENELLVRVDNTREPADRWYSGCGIYRPVSLVRMDARHLDEKKIVVETAFDGEAALLSVETGASLPVRARLTAPDGEVFEAEGCERLCLRVPRAIRWSAERPALYRIELTLTDGGAAVDRIALRIGLRDARFTADGLFVNGEMTKLRGVCLHQDFACVGVAVAPELWRERLLLLKGMGCNAVRCAHHLYAEEFLDLCDELGFYVYEECFDKWHSGLYGRYFDADWRDDLDAMILRDRNRPSVLLWGVGNEVENQAQPAMLKTLTMLAGRARELDPSRPVTYAMNPHFKRPANVDLSAIRDIQAFVDEIDEREIEDIDERVARIADIAALVDVVSCNYQEQWYERIRTAVPDKPILGTEVYQYFMGHPENMQNYVEHVPSFFPEGRDYVLGSFVWTGFDYLGESMGWPSKGWTGSIFRTNHVPRFSYYLLKSRWTPEPQVRVAILDYSLPDECAKESWAMPPYEEVWDFPDVRRAVLPFMVATNCERVELRFGDRRLILDERSRDANGAMRGFVPYVPGRLTAVGFIGGKPVCEHVLETPGPAARLEFERRQTPGGQMLFTVRALDAEGRFAFRARATVRFALEGAGRIVATDNGDLTRAEPYASPAAPLFRGRASVLVDVPKGETAAVTASAEGLSPARLALGSAQIQIP